MIEFRNVSFSYGNVSEKKDSISEISFFIKKGETVLFCGDSGCGKSTVGRLINGLIPNYYEGNIVGEIYINGVNSDKCSLEDISNISGSVFQNPKTQFFTVDTTSELAFASENKGVSETEIISKIKKTVRLFNIDNLLGENIFSLSGGEKQKIACASVSVTDPDIIILDEPSSNLDKQSTKDLRNIIELWKKQGKTIIIAEHRLYYLQGLLDHIFYMESGRIVDCYDDESKFYEQHKSKIRPFTLSKYPIEVRKLTGTETFILSNLKFAYKKNKMILDIENLQFPLNNVVAIIGDNGVGKSTFARCICGLESKDRSKIKYNDKILKKKDRLRNCYMVMQDTNHQLFTESVEDELLLGADKTIKNDIISIMEELNLLELRERHPMSLSGGQKQRVAIASALSSNRDILIFDEPTSGLDLSHMIQVANEIKKLADKKKTVIIITHDYEFIATCCNYVIQMDKGQIKEQYLLDDKGFVKLKEYFLN